MSENVNNESVEVNNVSDQNVINNNDSTTNNINNKPRLSGLNTTDKTSLVNTFLFDTCLRSPFL